MFNVDYTGGRQVTNARLPYPLITLATNAILAQTISIIALNVLQEDNYAYTAIDAALATGVTIMIGVTIAVIPEALAYSRFMNFLGYT